jgi:hypothetical protein
MIRINLINLKRLPMDGMSRVARYSSVKHLKDHVVLLVVARPVAAIQALTRTWKGREELVFLYTAGK